MMLPQRSICPQRLDAASAASRYRIPCGRRSIPMMPNRGSRTTLGISCLLKTGEGFQASWSQDLAKVTIRIPVATGTRGREVQLEVHRKRLKMEVGGRVALEGTIDHPEGVEHEDAFFEMEDESDGRVVLVTLPKREVARDQMSYEPWTRLFEQAAGQAELVTHRAFMDLSIGGDPAGRLIIGLFGSTAPRTVQNFLGLCKRRPGPSGLPLSYQGTHFFRIMPGFMVQGGDVVRDDGSGGQSIYGAKFEDENFVVCHVHEGYVAMANTGPNTNSSQFHITLGQFPFLDGKHVVFGKVLHGLEVLRTMETVQVLQDRAQVPIQITRCGELSEQEYQAALPGLAPEPEARINPTTTISGAAYQPPTVNPAKPSSNQPRKPRVDLGGSSFGGGSRQLDAQSWLNPSADELQRVAQRLAAEHWRSAGKK